MYLRFSVKGATQEENERGLAAAKAVFEATGIDPLTAAEGMFAVEGWDVSGFPANGLNDKDAKAASVWLDAEEAAFEAACSGWPEERRSAARGSLELLLPDHEERAAEREAMTRLAT